MRRISKENRGFSVIELMVAVLVLMIGVVAVAKLIPTAMRLNLANRYDTTSVVIAQRVLEILANQPVATPSATSVPPNCYSYVTVQQAANGSAAIFLPTQSGCTTPAYPIIFQVGNLPPVVPGGLACPPITAAGPSAPVLAPNATYVTAQGTIDWTQGALPGFSAANLTYPADPTGQTYEARWAVATWWGIVGCGTTLSPNTTPTVLSRRIIVSVRRSGWLQDSTRALIPPTTLRVVRTNGSM